MNWLKNNWLKVSLWLIIATGIAFLIIQQFTTKN